MSEPDNFLSRWSRRKQEVARQEAKTDTAPPPAAAPQENQKLKEAKDPSSDKVAAPPPAELVKLPSLDEIAADTDITGFLKPGVPADLARAALRRAWTSDPAVRDFVGLQENDWVFNKPGPAEGFGPLGPETDVRQMLARIMGEPQKGEPTPDSADDVETAAKVAPEPSEVRQDLAAAPPPSDPPEVMVQRNNEEPESPDPEPRRSHGGALPKAGSET